MALRGRRISDRADDGEFYLAQLLLTPLLVQMVALLKLGHDLFGKQLQGLHNVLVLAVTALREEVQDVEVGGFVLADILTDKFRRADEHAAPAHAVQYARAF